MIPAFNEGASIVRVVQTVKAEPLDADVVVISDGSEDGTAALARAAGARVLELPVNLGIGAAMQTGFRYADAAGYEWAAQVDGDGQHRPADIHRLHHVLRSRKCNMVVGSRFLDKRVGGWRSTWLRRLGSRILRIGVRWASGAWIADPTSGFRLCDKSAVRFFAQQYPDDYPEPESLVALLRAGGRVTETQTTMYERSAGRSSIDWFHSVYYMLKVNLALILSFGTGGRL